MGRLTTHGLTVEQLRTMDGDGRVRKVVPVSVPVGFYGQHPLRTLAGMDVSDVSITEVNDIPDPDRRPWYEIDETGGVL